MRQGPHQSAQKSTSTGTGTFWMISSNKVSSTARGSDSGGNGDLQRPQRPVRGKYFAGTRLFWPQWLQARITGKEDPLQAVRCCLFGCFGGFRSLQQEIKDPKGALPFLRGGVPGTARLSRRAVNLILSARRVEIMMQTPERRSAVSPGYRQPEPPGPPK
jgi:hypothetical protein